MEGKTQKAAAAIAAMSERTARRWQRRALSSVRRKNRHRWRNRPDPFADVEERMDRIHGAKALQGMPCSNGRHRQSSPSKQDVVGSNPVSRSNGNAH